MSVRLKLRAMRKGEMTAEALAGQDEEKPLAELVRRRWETVQNF